MYWRVCAAVTVLVLVLVAPMGRACPRTCNCYQANEVHCTFRSLLAIPAGLPAHTQRINLGFNSISRIPDNSLAGLKRAELLMLHGNDLHHIPDGAFRDMKSLQVLKLSYNKLREISSALMFSGLTSLLRLHLDHNLLQHIHPRTLLQLPSLRLLRLQGNRLHQLHPHTLCTLSLLNTYYYSTLRHLDLSNNSLTVLPRDAIVTAPLLESLALQANPWSCDCRMKWFLSWSLAHPGLMKCGRGSQCPVCALPKPLQGQGFLQQTDLSCTPPVISSPGRDSPSEADLGENQPIESFREPLGAASLGLSDHQGDSVDLSCNITHSTNFPDITPPSDPSLPSSSPLSIVLSLSLDCPVERESYERLWRILAYYSETAVRLEREIMLSKAPALAYRYRQVAETEGYYNTEVRASIKAKPHWLLQPAISIQLNRAQSSRQKVQLILTTRVSARPDPISHTSSSSYSPFLHPWVLIPTNHTATSVAALVGSRAEISCPILSSGSPTLQWILPDGSKLISPSSSPDGRLWASASGLLIRRTESLDAGLYLCVAQAGEDVDVLPVRLAVEESSVAPPGEQMGPSVTGVIGDAVSLPCEVSGTPIPDVSWLLPDGNMIQFGSSVSGGITIKSNGNLSLPRPSLKHAGQYRCMAVNQYGADSLSMWLDLNSRSAPSLSSSFPRGPQSAAGQSTRIRVPLLRRPNVEEGSGDEEDEEEARVPTGNRRRPRPPQLPLNQRYPIGHPRRRGPVRGGPLRRGGAVLSPFEQRRNRFENRNRGSATKQRIDPQKWADLLAKIRQRTALNTTSQPSSGGDAGAEPKENDNEKENRRGGNEEDSNREKGKIETEGSSIDDASLQEEGLHPIHIETAEKDERPQRPGLSRPQPQSPQQGFFPNMVPNSRSQSPWNTRRRLGPRRKINNRNRGRPLTPPQPLPDPTSQRSASIPISTTATTVHTPTVVFITPIPVSTASTTIPTTTPTTTTSATSTIPTTTATTMTSSTTTTPSTTTTTPTTDRTTTSTTSASVHTIPTTTTSTSTRGERPSPGLVDPRRRTVSGTPNQSRPPPEWKSPGANFIPDSHSSRPRLPSSPRLPASPRVPVMKSRPRIADPHIRTVSAPAESTAGLNCEAQGEPQPSITWIKVSTGAVMSVHSRAQRFEVLPNGTFVIQNVQLQDRGTYICSAHSSLGRDRMLTTLEVWSRPPRMQLVNYREATIHQGGELHLDCQADGVPTPLLSWVLPDRSVLTPTDSSHSRMVMHKNGTLHISVILPSDRGAYRCVASNSAGAASNSVRVHVSSLPPVIHQSAEEHLVLTAGMPVYAHCSARGAPPPTLRWRIPDGTLVRPSQFLHGNIFILPNGTLHIRRLEPKHAGSYECMASNAVGSVKRTIRVELQGGTEGAVTTARQPNSSATQHKGGAPSLPIPSSNTLNSPELSLPSSPSDRSRTSLPSPGSSGSPLPPFHPRLPDSPHSPLENKTLIGISPTHSSTFNDIKFSPLSPSSPLYPSNPTNNTKLSPPSVTSAKVSPSAPTEKSRGPPPLPFPPISHLSKARITSSSPSVTSVHYGGFLHLHCSVSGNPTPTIIWRTPNRKLVDMHFSFDRRLKVQPNGSLSVQAVTEKDAGDYLCIARNKVADDYRLLRVSVATKPAKIEPKQPSNQMVSLGGSLKVDCLASGLPDPAVSWSLPDGTMVNSVLLREDRAGRSRRLTVFDNGTLLVPTVGMGEEGEYTCYAKNQGGQDTMKVKVKVMMTLPPTFTDNPSYKVIKVRQEATAAFRCQAAGDPTPKVTWFSPNNRAIPRSSGLDYLSERVVVKSDGTLEIRLAQSTDAGNYTCQASNTLGERSRVVGLEVEIPNNGPTSIVGGSGVSVRVNGRGGSSSSSSSNNSGGSANTGITGTSATNGGTSNSTSPVVSVVTSVKQRAVKGHTVILPCPSHGSPPPRLAWLLPGNGILSAPYYGSRLTVYRNGSLELRGVRASDSGELVCVVRGEIRVKVELVVSETQEEATAQHGGTAVEKPTPRGPGSFTAPHSGGPPASPESAHSQGPRPVFPQTLNSRNLVTEKPPQRALLTPAAPRAVGPVLGSGGPGSEPVRQQPVVNTRTASLVTIINGESLRLSCKASPHSGYNQGSLSWTLPSGEVLSRGESSGGGQYSVLEDGTLIVQQASVFDRGSYACRSTNQESSSTSVVTVPVIVIAYPPRITTGPSPVTYTRPGVALELPCLAIATPRATITWETPDLSQLRATGQARNYGNRYLSAHGSLVIQNPTSRDTGFYRCTAKNVIGADTKATYLHVV
ncbi:matrix-remodeling-associated protein 5-like [Lampris incognitus]|uniref:matrix-remodeling-associated protein 5-like n=1 Tax=Lampris incognitus TaxID=2546036 RepID=UPI0024B488F8|nr:matrix-remodeling-associated protein 5-like [Lampris incognitus]